MKLTFKKSNLAIQKLIQFCLHNDMKLLFHRPLLVTSLDTSYATSDPIVEE